jgi:hypothetical protein
LHDGDIASVVTVGQEQTDCILLVVPRLHPSPRPPLIGLDFINKAEQEQDQQNRIESHEAYT